MARPRLFVFLAVASAVISPVMANAQVIDAIDLTAGVAIQNDSRRGLGAGTIISPIGATAGAIGRGLFGIPRLALVDQLSFFPMVGGDWVSASESSGGSSRYESNASLLINTALLRVSSNGATGSSSATWFAGAGLTNVLWTPRDGRSVAPTFAAGVRFGNRRRVELSAQCTTSTLGRTDCILPFARVWRVGH